MKKDCNDLVADYLAWLRTKFTVSDVNGTCEITTPFLDRHNDRLQIYVQEREGELYLTDDGYIIGDLEASGCSLDSRHRRELLTTTLNGFGVRTEEGSLVINASKADFPRKKHALVQAMLAVNDLFVTAASRVTNLFLEDVTKFLEENEIRSTPAVEFTGKSGFVHRFDFVIPKTRKMPERIIRAVNHPTRDSATSILFAWNDTKEVRPDAADLYAILNDSERTPSSDFLSALHLYDVKTILWSERNRFVETLAA